jgi:hypothetical protein
MLIRFDFESFPKGMDFLICSFNYMHINKCKVIKDDRVE